MTCERARLLAGASHFAVGTLASWLRQVDIEVMPLKGALLLQTTHRGRLRSLSDVDLLVRPRDYLRALQHLARRGFVDLARDRDDKSRVLRGPLPLVVDLHQRLHPKGLYRFKTERLMARGSRDESLFGAPILRMDSLDLYAHLLTHFARSRFGSERRAGLDDLRIVADAYDLSPRAIAAHLRKHGAARAGHYVLPLVGDARARATLVELPPDWFGQRLATFAHRGFRLGGVPSVLACHALNESLPRGAASAASHLLQGARQRLGQPRRVT